jgi:hypothetical protein
MKFDKVLYFVAVAQVCHSIWTAQEENTSVRAWKHAIAKQVTLIKSQQA